MAGGDPKDLRGFFALQVEEVQEQRGALALRWIAERANDLIAEVGGRERVLGLTVCECPPRGELLPAEPAPPS